MPISIQFDTNDFTGKTLSEERLTKRLEEKFGPETPLITKPCRDNIRKVVTEMRNSLNETSRRVDMEGTAMSWAFVRYKHDPADAAMLSGNAPAAQEPPAPAAKPKIPTPRAVEPEPEVEPAPTKQQAPPPKVASPKVTSPKVTSPKVTSPKVTSPKARSRSPSPSPKPKARKGRNVSRSPSRSPSPRRGRSEPRGPAPRKAGAGIAAAAADTKGMTVDHVEEWLLDVGLDGIVRHFRDNNVTGKSLLQLKAISGSLPTEAFIGFLKEEFGLRRTGDILHLMYSLEHDLKTSE